MKNIQNCSLFRRNKSILYILGLLFLLAVLYPDNLFANSLKQDNTISGTVTDGSTNEPLPGVTILVKGTATGTITDIEGKFSIQASPEDILVFSFVGYLTEEITVGDQTMLEIVLAPSIIDLDELVVIGYGVQKKKLNTGSSLNVNNEEIMSRNTSTAMDALQGISPGVTITRNNGLPGSGTKVYVRGIGTTGHAEPLYIVDGVAVEDIDYLNPSDIESIDVLKDGATAAIYGSRAANGVILVTTKKGKPGKIQVTYDGYIGISNPWKLPEMLNAQQYAEIMDSARMNSGQPLFNYETLVPDWNRIQSGEWTGTNWLDEFQNKNAFSQSHAFSVSGGNNVSTFTAGVSFLEEEGIFGSDDVNSTYKRFNLRFNSTHILWEAHGRKILEFGENLTYTNEKNPTIRTGNIYWSDIHNMLVCNPFLPLYGDTEEDQATPFPYHYSISWDALQTNPMAGMELQSKWNWNNNNTIVGNAYLDFQPLKNLHVRSSIGLNNYYGSSRQWQPAYDFGGTSTLDMDATRQSMYSGYTWTFTNTASYNFSLRSVHNFTVLLGTESIKNASDLSMQGYNRNSIFQNPEYAYLTNAPEINPTYTEINGRDDYGWGMISYFGRLSYDYREKYLLTGVLRRDGSSNFARGHRWGIFPSLSAGWVMSSEPFMESISSVVNYMKIRASYGQNGNENIDKFQYLASISYGDVDNNIPTEYYFFGLDKTQFNLGGFPPILPNPDVTWETSVQWDVGLDVYFLSNKLQFTADVYDKTTRDWLVDAPALASNGTGAPYINGGDVTNRGVELMLAWNEHRGNFSYGVTGTFGYNHNEVTEIANDEKIIHGPGNVLSQGTSEVFRAEVGYPIGYFWGLETDGVIQNQAEADAYVGPDGELMDIEGFSNPQGPGDLRFVDQNGDGVINDEDKVMIGDPNPHYIYSIQFNAEYKGIFIQIVGTGQGGNQIAKSYRSFGDSPRNNFTTDIYDRWTGEGTSDRIPRISYTPIASRSMVSDLYIEDGDFFRISNLTIGYDLSKGIKIIPFKETRLYFAAKNLLTFTKYSGMDPEVGYSPDNYDWASGIDLGLYPVARTYMVGLSIKF